MKSFYLITLLLSSVFGFQLFAQTASAGSRAENSPAPAPNPGARESAASALAGVLDPEVGKLLQRVEQLASSLNVDLGRVRVERWKTDSASKQQAGTDIDSLQRNLTAALPGFVAAVRNSPQNLAASFRLYRNLNALRDVLNGVTESAGAFGPRNQFERLAAQASELDSLCMELGKRVEALAEAQALELAQLRRKLQPGAGSVPKKIVVDDNAPQAKPKSRKAAKPAQQSSQQKN